MSQKKILILAPCIAILLTAGVSVWAEQASVPKETAGAAVKGAPAAGGIMDKRALGTLKLMSDTISKARTVRFQALSMVPKMTKGGVWINLFGTSRVVMQGPDRLFASTTGDIAAHDLYFDGKTITKYSPGKNIYSVKEVPGTIDDLIERAYREEGKTFPYADILISEPYEAMTDGLVSALYVGQSTLRAQSGQSITTDHLAMVNKGVQWQIWIGAEDHLPRLVCATYLDEASEPSYTVEFGDWKLDEPVSADDFIFKNVSQAAKVGWGGPMRQERKVSVPAAGEEATKGGR